MSEETERGRITIIEYENGHLQVEPSGFTTIEVIGILAVVQHMVMSRQEAKDDDSEKG